MEQKKRSKLSKAAIIKWLKKHRKGKTTNPYFYYPQELVQQQFLQKIFKQFDSDGSGGLSREEVFEMFNGFGIQITMSQLNALYDSVEPDLAELDCLRFKKCVFSQKSGKTFRSIVQELEGGYLPHSFISMIIYLVYLGKRQELKMLSPVEPIQQQFQNVSALLKLNDLQLNNDKLTLYADQLKHSLNNKFRNVWDKINDQYDQKFSLTTKLESQFYQFYRNRKFGL